MTQKKKIIRYAVVGLGYISQVAVLPGFKTARKNSQLTAFISGNPKKMDELSDKYNVSHCFSYEDYDDFLKSDVADAVYIALPNHMHKEFSVKAANAGLHVLCEKPMALSPEECQAMIDAADKNKVKLMIAYRLHLEPGNIEALRTVASGKLGRTRVFNSLFSRQVKPGDIRLKEEMGGGSVWDLGIYCINAARTLFQSEPTHVQAVAIKGTDKRFREVDEMTTAILHFPDNRTAVFTSSFGGADTSLYEVVGTDGVMRMEPAYDYALPLNLQVTVNEKTKSKKFPLHDQFGAELMYFSDCILKGKNPEPSGREGQIDVKIIQAIYKAAQTGGTVALSPLKGSHHVKTAPKITLPPVKKPKLVEAEPMSQ